jgi:acyl-CoA synthetase (AMP-forming)/AMP-acid ligase II
MSIAMLLDSIASAVPDRVLVGPRRDGLTCGELRERAGAGARIIRDSGVDAVGFIGISGSAFPIALFAAALAGVPFTPINYRLPGDQLAELAARLGSHPLLIVDQAYAHAVRGTSDPVLVTEDWLAATVETRGEPATDVDSVVDGDVDGDVDDEQPAVVLYTSGTTAKPKGAVLRHRHLSSYVLQTVEFCSAEATDAALISVPPYHVAGVGTVLTNTFAGRRLVYLPNFTAGDWLHAVRAEGITQAMLVPTMLARIVEHLDGKPADVPTLRSIAYGGARMPRPVLEAALTAMPDVAFANAYGLTETSSTIAVLGPEDHRAALTATDDAVRARLGSVGRLVPGVEARIRDEVGNPLPPGQSGQLWVRGDQVAGEYLGSGSLLDADGWFHTRDQAWLDDEDYLFIGGRTDDTIIRGGENIAPAEIEDVLVHQPGVREVAVIGLPDDEWGARIVAVIVPHPDARLTVDDVRGYARARLRGSRTPDDVVFVDQLPHTPTGKLIRRDLVAMVASPAATS